MHIILYYKIPHVTLLNVIYKAFSLLLWYSFFVVRHECRRGAHGKPIGVLDDCCSVRFHRLFPFQSDLFPWRWLQWRTWLACGQRRTRRFFVVGVVTYGLVNGARRDVVSTAGWFWAVLWIFRNSLWQSAASAWHLIILLQRYYSAENYLLFVFSYLAEGWNFVWKVLYDRFSVYASNSFYIINKMC